MGLIIKQKALCRTFFLVSALVLVDFAYNCTELNYQIFSGVNIQRLGGARGLKTDFIKENISHVPVDVRFDLSVKNFGEDRVFLIAKSIYGMRSDVDLEKKFGKNKYAQDSYEN